VDLFFLGSAIFFIASLIQSVFGFGSALFAMPLLVMFVSPMIATPTVALVSAAISVAMLARDRRHVNVSPVLCLIVASACGVPFGLFFLVYSDVNLVREILGGVIFLNSIFNIFCFKKINLTGCVWMLCAGFLSGLLGGAYNISGPPVILYAVNQKWPVETLVVSLQAYFLATGFIIILGHWVSGFWTEEVFRLFLFSVPASLLGVWTGRKLRHFITPSSYERIVHVVLAFLGISLFLQGFNNS